jgi:hypothetical protein
MKAPFEPPLSQIAESKDLAHHANGNNPILVRFAGPAEGVEPVLVADGIESILCRLSDPQKATIRY